MDQNEEKNNVNKEQLIKLRKETGMNRKEFCKYFDIPYSTMTDWELGHRTMPDYLLRLMTYKIKTEAMMKKDKKNKKKGEDEDEG
ncbi:MAG: helix-turn-helix transcriptional regulator [Lachnospiraceae bacterium]|nr:helix-turn-helix transcriptional regulator [Lachnospiraceae bacterium]